SSPAGSRTVSGGPTPARPDSPSPVAPPDGADQITTTRIHRRGPYPLGTTPSSISATHSTLLASPSPGKTTPHTPHRAMRHTNPPTARTVRTVGGWCRQPDVHVPVGTQKSARRPGSPTDGRFLRPFTLGTWLVPLSWRCTTRDDARGHHTSHSAGIRVCDPASRRNRYQPAGYGDRPLISPAPG